MRVSPVLLQRRPPNALLDFDFRWGREQYWLNRRHYTNFQRVPGATSTGGAGFGQALRNGAWSGNLADGVPLIGDGGLGVYEARTNSIRNPVGAGAVAGTPGTLPTNWGVGVAGVSYSVLGSGVESGIPGVYIRFFGTPTANLFVTLSAELANQVVAAAGQTWTGQFYARLAGGTTTNLSGLSTRLQEYQNNTYLAQPAVQPTTQATSALARFPASGALADGSTNRVRSVFVLLGTTGLPVDVTLFIGGPQLKLGPDINDPPILQTSGLPATRTASGIGVPQAPDTSVGTVIVEVTWPLVNAPNRFFAEPGSGGSLSGFSFSTDNGLGASPRINYRNGADEALRFDSLGSAVPTPTPGQRVVFGLSWGAATVASINGASVARAAASPQANFNPAHLLSLGSRGVGGSGWTNSGLIRRVTWDMYSVDQAALNARTAL